MRAVVAERPDGPDGLVVREVPRPEPRLLGALPETFVTAAGSLEHLDLEAGETLLLRGATSSVGLACLELARARACA